MILGLPSNSLIPSVSTGGISNFLDRISAAPFTMYACEEAMCSSSEVRSFVESNHWDGLCMYPRIYPSWIWTGKVEKFENFKDGLSNWGCIYVFFSLVSDEDFFDISNSRFFREIQFH